MSVTTGVPAVAAITTDAPTGPALPQEPREGTLVVVMGSKGGVGTTLIACNLAMTVASERSTCLIDLDVTKGDVAGLLDLRSGRSVNTLLDRLDGADDALLQGASDVIKGLTVVAQPYDLAELHDVSAAEARGLLSFLRRRFDVVVVDVGSHVGVASLAAALVATEILLVATPEVSSLRDAQRTLRLLHHLGLPADRVRLVLNRMVANPAVSAEEAAEQLGVPITAQIVSDRAACRRADTAGRLLLDEAPYARVTAEIRYLWKQLNPEGEGSTSEPAEPARTTSWWRR